MKMRVEKNKKNKSGKPGNKSLLKKVKSKKKPKVKKNVIGNEYFVYLIRLYQNRDTVFRIGLALALSFALGYVIWKYSQDEEQEDLPDEETPDKDPPTTNPPSSDAPSSDAPSSPPINNNKNEGPKDEKTEATIITSIIALATLLFRIVMFSFDMFKDSIGGLFNYIIQRYYGPILAILTLLGVNFFILLNALINNVAASPYILAVVGAISGLILLVYILGKFKPRFFSSKLSFLQDKADNLVIDTKESILKIKSASTLYQSLKDAESKIIKNKGEEATKDIEIKSELGVSFQLTKGLLGIIKNKTEAKQVQIGNTLMQVAQTMKNKKIGVVSSDTMDIMTDYMKKTTGLADPSIKKVKAFIYLGSVINEIEEQVEKLNDEEKQKLLQSGDLKALLKNIDETDENLQKLITDKDNLIKQGGNEEELNDIQEKINSYTGSELRESIKTIVESKEFNEAITEIEKSNDKLIDEKFQVLTAKISVIAATSEELISLTKDALKDNLPDREESIDAVKQFLKNSFEISTDKAGKAKEIFDTALNKAVNNITKSEASIQVQENAKENLKKLGERFMVLGNDVLTSIKDYTMTTPEEERLNKIKKDLIGKYYERLIVIFGKDEVESKIGTKSLLGNIELAEYEPEDRENPKGIDTFLTYFGFDGFTYDDVSNIQEYLSIEANSNVDDDNSIERFTRDINNEFLKKVDQAEDSTDFYRGRSRTRTRSNDFEDSQELNNFYIEALSDNYNDLQEVYGTKVVNKYIGNKGFLGWGNFKVAERTNIKEEKEKNSIYEFIKRPFNVTQIKEKLENHKYSYPRLDLKEYNKRKNELEVWEKVFRNYEAKVDDNLRQDIRTEPWEWHTFEK
jgi:hypothetical protein